jgi:hypothetical protein
VPAAEKWGVQVADMGPLTGFLLCTTFYRAWCKDRSAAAAIRLTATRCKLPVQRITEVRVLDPYFYK